MLGPVTVHVAAEPDGPLQRCAQCGTVLIDNSRINLLEPDDGRGGGFPGWWTPGRRVATTKTHPDQPGVTYLVNDRPLDANETVCGATN